MAAGDDAALLELHTRYAPHLMTLMRRMVGGKASEGVEEVFVRVWETAGAFEPARESAQAWLVITAHRVALEHKRKGPVPPFRRVDPDVKAGVGSSVSVGISPGNEIAGDDGDALNALELLDKAFYEGCSVTELAAATGASPAAVSAALRAALHKLAQARAEQNAERGDDA